PLPESYYCNFEPLPVTHTPAAPVLLPDDDISGLVRRLRHMYQTGLLKVLQGAQIKPSLGMMARALERLEGVTGESRLSSLWWLAGAMLNALSEEKLQLTKGRKLLLSALDREIKRLQFEGKAGLGRPVDKALVKELVYLVALSRLDNEKTGAIADAFGIAPLGYSE